MGANHQVIHCTCPGCRHHRFMQGAKRAALYIGITVFLAIAIGVWTYHNALEFAKLHQSYNIPVFP